MNAPLASEPLLADAPRVEFTLDGKTVAARADETIWSVARREGTTIPHLCHSDGLRAGRQLPRLHGRGGRRRVLAASCCRSVDRRHEGQTGSERASSRAPWCSSC